VADLRQLDANKAAHTCALGSVDPICKAGPYRYSYIIPVYCIPVLYRYVLKRNIPLGVCMRYIPGKSGGTIVSKSLPMALTLLRVTQCLINTHLSVLNTHLSCGCALLSFAQSRYGAAACAHFHAHVDWLTLACKDLLASVPKNASQETEINSCSIYFQWYPC
jgi:hypothetical protein